jgi:talin
MKNVRPVNASAEEVVVAAREVLTSTADLVFANDQGTLIEAGNTAYNAVEKLLSSAAGASKLSPDQNIQKGITLASNEIGKAMVDLLETSKLNRADENTLPKLDNSSSKVTAATTQLVEALRKLPNSQNISLDEKGDLDKVAEEELLKCANIIKEAARALEAAKPERKTPKIPGVLDRIDIDTAIVDAAQAIANATGILVQHAYGAQRERLEKRRQPGQRYRNDPAWANGLISASHSVADSVQSLVKAANKAATGMADEEELVATARAVAASTAHLVSASRAKADPSSAAHKQLSDAAKAVANATSSLVSAATKAGNLADEAAAAEAEEVNLSFGGAASKAKEMESQIKILKLEKELEKERMRMLNMRKTKK